MTLSQLTSDAAKIIAIASVAVNFLPKSTVFSAYPRFQKAYETGINVIIALACNVRKQLPSLDVHIPGLGFTPEPKKPDGG